MKPMGLFEAMAREDLDRLVREIGARYPARALDALAAADPAWARELDRAEREVGALYAALRDGDRALADWPGAVAELSRVWRRVLDPPTDGFERSDSLLERDVA
jgi:hypothetical protein